MEHHLRCRCVPDRSAAHLWASYGGRRSESLTIRSTNEVLDMRKFLLIAALLAAGCSSEPAKPKPPVEQVPTEAELAAAKPMSIRLATGGDVNTMPSIAAAGDRIAVVWVGTTKGAMDVYVA